MGPMRTLPVWILGVALAACSGAVTSPDGGLPADEDVGSTPGGDGSTAPGLDASSVPGLDASAAPGLDASAAAGTDAASGDPQTAAWLKEHNDERASAQPTPSPALQPLTWSDAAATVASAWAAKCTWSHNAGRGNYGENIAAATNALTPASVVAMWAGEAKDYDYATNGCTGVCGHYTQLVWRSTTAVGCAIQRCTTGSPFSGGTWYFAVCDYSPPGNYTGNKPY